MKHVNSISQINIERDREIIRLFQKAKRLVPWPTTTTKICCFISRMPTPCYYLSFDAAYRYVSLRLKGKIPKFGKYQQMKQSLCEAFYIDFLEVKRQKQDENLCTYRLVELALLRPAPHLGIAPNYIQKKIAAYYKQSRHK